MPGTNQFGHDRASPHLRNSRMNMRDLVGVGCVALTADEYGSEQYPCAVLLPSITQTRKVWNRAAKALAEASRYVRSLDWRRNGGSDSPKDYNYSLEDCVRDWVAVLAQLESRSVVVDSNFDSWIGLAVLGNTSVPIATGLVLTNPPPEFQSLNNKSNAKTVSEPTSSEDFDQGLFTGGFDFIELQNQREPAAKNLKLSTLLVRGIDSQLSSYNAMQRFAQLIPQTEVSEMEGAGNCFAFHRGDKFSALVLEFLENHVPHPPLQYVSSSDARTLRAAMGYFVTGITVITTLDDTKKPIGLTVNAFSLVSLNPPLISICLGNHVGSLDNFRAKNNFLSMCYIVGSSLFQIYLCLREVDRFVDID